MYWMSSESRKEQSRQSELNLLNLLNSNRKILMKIADAFPSKYLSAADLQDRTISVVIEIVSMEEVGDDEKPIVYFRGKQKGLVLNKTNATTIALMHGEDTDNWTGKVIALWPTQTEFQGRAVPCIRVKLGKSPAVAEAEVFVEEIKPDPSQGEMPADDIPF